MERLDGSTSPIIDPCTCAPLETASGLGSRTRRSECEKTGECGYTAGIHDQQVRSKERILRRGIHIRKPALVFHQALDEG